MEGDVDNSLRDVVVHLLQLLGLLDQHSELLAEIHLVMVLSHLHQDLFFQELHGTLHDVVRPGRIFVLLVEVDFLHQVQVLFLYLFEELFLKLVLVLVELDDRAFHPSHEGLRPADDACDWWLASADDQSDLPFFVTGLALREQLAVDH